MEEHPAEPGCHKEFFRTLLFLSKWCLSGEQIGVEFGGRFAATKGLSPARPDSLSSRRIVEFYRYTD
jgi:hypothetical protein